MNEIKLSIDLVNAILQYLGSQPYVEVASIIGGIQQQANEQGIKPIEKTEEISDEATEENVLVSELVED